MAVLLSFAALYAQDAKRIEGVIGIGYAWFDTVKPELEVDTTDQMVMAVYGEKGNGIVFSPRIGVQMFRLRLTCSYTIANKYNSHMMSGVGFVIGGGKRQKADRITFD